MTSEVEWRRRWRPGLAANPWQPVTVQDTRYLLKYCFVQDSYEVLFTDLTDFWYESLEESSITKRIKKLNPGIEAPLTRILDKIQGCLDKAQKGKDTSLKMSFKDDPESNSTKMMMTINSNLAGMPFTWNFICKQADNSMGSEHLVVPVLAMVGELARRQQELVKLLQNKDKEIDDYKSQGAKVTRKHIETAPFVETAFEMSMLTSKGFEAQVGDPSVTAFTEPGQDLYRQVMTKKAWLTRSPTKASTEDDSLDDDVPTQTTGKRAAVGQSWGNSRLPPSLVAARSPTKSPQKSSPSPSKSPRSSASATPEASPVKDSEMLRRQALERRLELEEQKKHEKAKKKKKIKF